jgi:hypothetical protein
MGKRYGWQQALAQTLRRTRAPARSPPTIRITELPSYEHSRMTHAPQCRLSSWRYASCLSRSDELDPSSTADPFAFGCRPCRPDAHGVVR